MNKKGDGGGRDEFVGVFKWLESDQGVSSFLGLKRFLLVIPAFLNISELLGSDVISRRLFVLLVSSSYSLSISSYTFDLTLSGLWKPESSKQLNETIVKQFKTAIPK